MNDPGYERHLGRGVNKDKAKIERDRLFDIIRRLVLWENTGNEALMREAREEIRKSWVETCELNKGHPEAATLFNPSVLPAFHDPFAGGGALPLEAQRLGLESYASDLNPVAVLLTWGAIHLIGGGKEVQEAVRRAQEEVWQKADAQITAWGIEHDGQGNRADLRLQVVPLRGGALLLVRQGVGFPPERTLGVGGLLRQELQRRHRLLLVRQHGLPALQRLRQR